MVFSGLSPDERLVEIAELADHPFMVGTQFHPEFLTRPNRPHPLFRAFVAAVAARARHTDGQATTGGARPANGRVDTEKQTA
jgi:CTP synthase (UTP-ammonia lyase)